MSYSFSRSTTSTDLSPLWDPRATLNLTDDDRCVGHAHSKHRKCRNFIAGYNLQKAETLLDRIALEQPDSELLRSKLRRLAEHLLCVRYHKDQARDMVDKWVHRMDTQYPEGFVMPRVVRRGSSHRERRDSFLLVSSTSSSSATSGSSDSGDEVSESVGRNPSSTLTRADRASTPSPSASRVSTSDISSIHLSRSSTTQSSSSTGTRVSHTATGTRPAPRTANSSAPPSRSCTRAHVRRRAIDDECPICREDFLQCDQLVWCKDGCGRTIHRDCFVSWEAQCISDNRRVTCAICRTVWGRRCECDD